MNVLQLISSGGMYGAERVAITLSQCINANGDRSVLAAFRNRHNPNLEVLKEAERQSIETRTLDCSGRFDWQAVRALRKLVASEHIDVLHTHNYKADLYGYAALRNSRAMQLATCHTWYDNDVSVYLYGALDRFILRKVQGVVAVSDAVADRLRASGIASRNIRQIDNGIEVQRFASGRPTLRAQFPRACFIIGVVARLAPEKGIAFLLQAAAKVRERCPGVLFLIVGDGPEKCNLQRLAELHHLRDTVLFLGKREDMADIYASLDLLVQPSLNEGLPMTILEAMASARPIVATAVGAIPTVLDDGRNGILVQPGDDIGLANAIISLIEMPTRREMIGRAAQETVRDRFSDRKMALEYLTIYRELLQARGSASVAAC